MEFRGPDEERALLGRIIGDDQVHGFGDAQPTGIEEMVEGVMAVSAVKPPRMDRLSDPLLEVVEEATEFRRREDVRAIGLRSRNRKRGEWILLHPPASHQVTAEPPKGLSPHLQGLAFESALVLIH
jgi:hypothetical protein